VKEFVRIRCSLGWAPEKEVRLKPWPEGFSLAERPVPAHHNREANKRALSVCPTGWESAGLKSL
jgi:hypothetical protein